MPKDEDSEEQDEDELTEEILSVYGTEDDIEPYKKVLERNDTSGKTERCSGVREKSVCSAFKFQRPRFTDDR